MQLYHLHIRSNVLLDWTRKIRIDKDATKFYQLWSGLKESLKGGGECDDAEEDKLLAGHGVSTLNPADKNGQESRQKAQ